MRIFVYDTETTWFINKKENNLDLQPRIIQFAWILWEIKNLSTAEAGPDKLEFIEEKRINILINPKIPIPFWSSQIHHLYDIDVQNEPFIENKIDEILTYINETDITIWHNIEYDEDMIKLELKRLDKEYKYKPKQVVCTMNSSINYCKLAKKMSTSSWYKRPKLWELHKKIFWEYFIWAHDAMTDVEATLRCFIELVKQGVIKLEEKKDEVMSLF